MTYAYTYLMAETLRELLVRTNDLAREGWRIRSVCVDLGLWYAVIEKAANTATVTT